MAGCQNAWKHIGGLSSCCRVEPASVVFFLPETGTLNTAGAAATSTDEAEPMV